MMKKFLFVCVLLILVKSFMFAIPQTAKITGIYKNDKGTLSGRYDVKVRLVYGANNTDTGFSETHNGIEFLDGKFVIDVGSVGTLTSSHINHDQLKFGIQVEEEKEFFLSVWASPTAIVSSYAISAGSVNWENIQNRPADLSVNVSTSNYAVTANYAARAGSVSWNDITDKASGLTVNVSTANYAINAGLATTAQTASSVEYNNIQNNPNKITGLVAGENLNSGDAIVMKSDGKIYKGDNSDITTVENFLGFISDSYFTGNTVSEDKIHTTSFSTSGLSAGSTYYIGTNGAVTTSTNPLTNGNPIGKAVSSSFLKIYQQPYNNGFLNMAGSNLRIKIFEIGDWNMDSGSYKDINHGMGTDFKSK